MRYKRLNIVTFVIFCILFIMLGLITYETPFSISKPQLLDGWNQSVDEEMWTYVGVHEITDTMCGRSISFMTNSAYVDANIGQDMIYHFGEKPVLGKSPGTYQHFIEIPEDAGGKELCITVTFCEASKIRDAYVYMLGDNASIVAFLLKQDSFTISMGVLMILFSGVLMVFHILGKKDAPESSQNIWLGLLILDFCLWSATKSFISQLLLKNSLLQYYMSYYFSFLIPICLINYVKSLFSEIEIKREYICNLVMIGICVVLHFLNIWTLSNSSRVFAVVMCFSIISIFVRVGYKFYIEKKIAFINITFMIFLACLIWNAVNYAMGIQNGEKTHIIQVGLLVYIVAALIYGANKIIVTAEESKAAEVYKEMAYTDNLTKLQNRHALRKNVEAIKLKDLCVVSMDLNNLKYYNDNLGHAYGDKLIQEAARVIQKTYKDCYRTGGDEFVAILQKVTREQAESYRTQLIRSWKEYNNSQDELVLEIASGNGYFHEGDQSYEDIMKRADDNMYYDKAYIKSHSKIKSTR